MKPDGGPAFPPLVEGMFGGDGLPLKYSGMSLRDYFVAHAPAAEIEACAPTDVKGCAALLGMAAEDYKFTDYYRVLAIVRGQWADAMLAEREK